MVDLGHIFLETLKSGTIKGRERKTSKKGFGSTWST